MKTYIRRLAGFLCAGALVLLFSPVASSTHGYDPGLDECVYNEVDNPPDYSCGIGYNTCGGVPCQVCIGYEYHYGHDPNGGGRDVTAYISCVP
ncbi:MAG TPA: hypothetical protein VI796_05755 [Candidatus Thermoplasmatota archaeon]|nr:hypothetical protein [Candidatus Thermoplasmatota archaeon]